MTAPKIINLADAIEQVQLVGVPVHGAPATGMPLHSNGHLGADILHVPAGKQFPIHTHPGDHLLYCLQGAGTISVAGVTYAIKPGDFYFVEGLVPHAVGAADADHILVAIGSPHKPVDSPERMEFVDWAGNKVTAPLLATEPDLDAHMDPAEYARREAILADLRAASEKAGSAEEMWALMTQSPRTAGP